MNTSNLPHKRSNKYLFKGEPKNCKSCAAASFPKPYIIDLDKRIRSVAAYWDGIDFEYDWFDDFTSLDKKLDSLMIHCEFETIVFDGITSFAEMIINTMIKTRPAGQKKIIRGGIEMTQIEDFGGEQRAFNVIFEKLFLIQQKLDVNVIVTAHVIEVEKAIRPGVTIKTRTLLTAGKKVAAFLPVHFDEVYHFQIDVPIEEGGIPRAVAFTKHSGDDWACTTYNVPAILDFTNQSFYEVLQDAKKEGQNAKSNDNRRTENDTTNETTGIEGLESSDKIIREERKISESIGDHTKIF